MNSTIKTILSVFAAILVFGCLGILTLGFLGTGATLAYDHGVRVQPPVVVLTEESPLQVTESNPTQVSNPVVENTAIAPQATLQAEPTQVTADFPLKGLRFPAYANGTLNTAYDLYVESNGRLWQKWLPACNQKVAHSVAFELSPGNYTFNGVVARLYLDVARNGKGSQNPMTVGNGNDLRFTVTLPSGAAYQTAWVLVESDGGCPAGFDLNFLGK